MLFFLLKHYSELYITDNALKVSASLYCFCTSIFCGVEIISPGCGVQASLMLFLCQLTCQSPDIMASLYGICVCVCVNNFSKVQGPETCCFLQQIPYLSRMKHCSRHANLLFVCSPESLQVRYPHPKCENFNTLSQFSHCLLQGFLS